MVLRTAGKPRQRAQLCVRLAAESLFQFFWLAMNAIPDQNRLRPKRIVVNVRGASHS